MALQYRRGHFRANSEGTHDGWFTRGLELLLAAAILILLATVALPVGWRWWADGSRFETTDDAYVTGDLRVLGAKVPGYVGKLLVADYQTVVAGQPIVQIEDDDYLARIVLADGVVLFRQAALDYTAAVIKQQQNVIDQASAQSDATEANAELARLQLGRARSLLGTPAILMTFGLLVFAWGCLMNWGLSSQWQQNQRWSGAVASSVSASGDTANIWVGDTPITGCAFPLPSELRRFPSRSIARHR